MYVLLPTVNADCGTDTPAPQNVDKMLWGLHHMMREDPCRDFAYGFTIEDTTMKMWYCDRSNIVISDEFDIHKVRGRVLIIAPQSPIQIASRIVENSSFSAYPSSTRHWRSSDGTRQPSGWHQ